VDAQFAAIVSWGGAPGSGTPVRPVAQPALVVNGKADVMVPTLNSYALFEQLPNAQFVLYPDSGHGALFQCGDTFVKEGLHFLAA
jgi:pimeloyl-ACP methyl ester carboxylesterase